VTDLTRPTPELSCDEVRDLAASFVLGALDADEAAAVRAHVATCADPHAELAELGSVLAVLAESVPVVEPPAALKGRIMAAAAADLEARKNVAVPPVDGVPPLADSAAPPRAFPSATEREARAARRTSSIGTWVLRIAAVLAIVALGGWNLLLQGQLNEARTYEQDVAAVLDTAGQPGSLTAILIHEGGTGPAGLAAVGSDGVVKLAMRDLAPTQGEQVYTTWVIPSDGVPVAVGDFRVGPSGTAYFEGRGLPTQDGIVLALTLEPQPGATAPSSTPVSVGTASAAG
jgi:anti-sigma-K factor RskA